MGVEVVFMERKDLSNVERTAVGIEAGARENGGAPEAAHDRILNTAEANAYLRRAKGFLEKRRSSGIDSPPYLQRTKRGAVLYRISDLIAWEDERTLTSSSDHADGFANRGRANRR